MAGLAGALALDDPRRRFPLELAAIGISTLGWLWISRAVASRSLDRPERALAVAAAILLRLAAWIEAPALSDDVFRYVYEGRVVWAMGPAFPFVHPPAEAPFLGVPPELIDAAWLRINHPDLPTIYPPFAQLTFAIAAGLGQLVGAPLAALKLALIGAELGAWALVAAALRAAGRSGDESLVLALCPTAVLEIARDGHGDSLVMLGFALAAWGFLRARPRVGYVGLALATLAKLAGVIALPAALRGERKGALWPGAVLLALLAAPFLLGGLGAGRTLGEYATSWRAGDGAFTLLLQLAEWILGGDWARFGEHTLTRHQLARGFAAILFAVAAAAIVRRPGKDPQAILERAAALVLVALLLGPTLHPWYALWLAPLLPFAGRFRAPAIALLALVPALHTASWLELEIGEWTDLGWVRAFVHAPPWLLLATALASTGAASGRDAPRL